MMEHMDALVFTPVKAVADIIECVRDIKQEYSENLMPITDDSTNLHRFCGKFEYILISHRKEKSSIFGGSRDYWDYFCSCLSKVKRCRDGVKFVRTLSELHTSLGKGRAFIRFNLVHQRLGEILQVCVQNGKVTSEYYTEDSVLLCHEQSNNLITHLYELIDVQFDLSAVGYDLDVSWPTFARKTFSNSPYSGQMSGGGYPNAHLNQWRLHTSALSSRSRSSSISSLTSNTSAVATTPQLYPIGSSTPDHSIITEGAVPSSSQHQTQDDLQQTSGSNLQQQQQQPVSESVTSEVMSQMKHLLHTVLDQDNGDSDTVDSMLVPARDRVLADRAEMSRLGELVETQQGTLNTLQAETVSNASEVNRLNKELSDKNCINEEYQLELLKLREELGELKTHYCVERVDKETDMPSNYVEIVDRETDMSASYVETVDKETDMAEHGMSASADVELARNIREVIAAHRLSHEFGNDPEVEVVEDSEIITRITSHVEQLEEQRQELGRLHSLLDMKEAECTLYRDMKGELEDKLEAESALSARIAAEYEALQGVIGDTSSEGQWHMVAGCDKEQQTDDTAVNQLPAPGVADDSTVNELRRELAASEESRSTLEQQLSDLRFQMSSQTIHYQSLLKQYESVHEEVDVMREVERQQEGAVTSLQSVLDQIRAEREHETRQVWGEVDDVKGQLLTKQEDLNTLQAELRKVLLQLSSSQQKERHLIQCIHRLRERFRDRLQRRDALARQLNDDCLQLKNKLVQLIREKDSLWKKSDQLEYKQRLKAAEKWMEDGDVIKCLGCKVEFSFMVRKHHCRLCGRIYCNNCADNWIMTTASSKKSRVCNACYISYSTEHPPAEGTDGSNTQPSMTSQPSLSVVSAVAGSSRDSNAGLYSGDNLLDDGDDLDDSLLLNAHSMQLPHSLNESVSSPLLLSPFNTSLTLPSMIDSTTQTSTNISELLTANTKYTSTTSPSSSTITTQTMPSTKHVIVTTEQCVATVEPRVVSSTQQYTASTEQGTVAVAQHTASYSEQYVASNSVPPNAKMSILSTSAGVSGVSDAQHIKLPVADSAAFVRGSGYSTDAGAGGVGVAGETCQSPVAVAVAAITGGMIHDDEEWDEEMNETDDDKIRSTEELSYHLHATTASPPPYAAYPSASATETDTNISNFTSTTDELTGGVSVPGAEEVVTADTRGGGGDLFHVVSDEEIAKSYTSDSVFVGSFSPESSLTSSMLLSVSDVQRGRGSDMSDVVIKAGRSFAVPVHLDSINTVLSWQFTTEPKDIIFSILYTADHTPQGATSATNAWTVTDIDKCKLVINPQRCKSHKHSVQGQLVTKQPGLYILMFDNSHSRFTNKKLSYKLHVELNS